MKIDFDRIPVRLPEWYSRRLRLWAFAKGTSKSALAQNILQARIECNEDEIDGLLREIADLKGMEVDDLISEILADSEDE